MQHWITLCYYQSRHPQLRYGSDAVIALEVFLAQHANGGVIEGKNIFIEYRSADWDVEQIPRAARELVASGVDLILPRGRGDEAL